jgi:hypothetical protein
VVNPIPGQPVAPERTPTESQQFFIESVSGQTFGPVTQSELDQWVLEGRISANCLIRPTGKTQFQPAWVYFPSLGTPASETIEASTSVPEKNPFRAQHPQKQPASVETNPYTPSTSVDPFRKQVNTVGLRPVAADLGEIFTRSFAIFQREMQLLLAVAVTCVVVNFITNLISQAMEEMHDEGQFLIALFAVFILSLIQTFLVIGQTRISLKLVRGQPASFGDLFGGGDIFWPVVGFYFLIFIPLCLGFLMLIIPGIFLMLYFWPAFSLIVDRKTGVFESFGVAGEIGSKNLFNSFLLGIASFGIVVAGLLLCCVGVFFSAGYLSVLWATAYLMMSGQIR